MTRPVPRARIPRAPTPRARTLRLLLLPHLLAAVLFTACTGTDDAADAPDTPAVETLLLDPAVTLGDALEADPEYLFGDVRSVAADEDGRIYVGDRIGALVRAYTPEGRFLSNVAEEGEGPGEIEGWPADLTFGPEGKLYVRDASRVTVFGPRTPGAPADSLLELWQVPGYGNLTMEPSHVAADGTYFYPASSHRPGERGRFFYVVFRDGAPTGDTLEVPPHPGMGGARTAFYRISAGSGRMVEGLNRVPFAPVPSWEITHGGTLLSTDGRRDVLLETDLAGDTLRVIRLEGAGPRAVPPAERADSLAALEARIDSLPVPLEEVVGLGEGVAGRELPDTLPAILSVHEVQGGELWIERWPPEGRGDARSYDVYHSGGDLLRRVVLRAPLIDEPPPYVRGGSVVGVVRDPATDVHRVVKFDVPPGRRR